MNFHSALGQQQAQRGGGWQRFGPFRSDLLSQGEERAPEPESETPDPETPQMPERSVGGFGDLVGGALVYRAEASYRVPLAVRRDVSSRRPADPAATDVLADVLNTAERIRPEPGRPSLVDELRAIRARAIARGMPLLTVEEIEAELARRRDV